MRVLILTEWFLYYTVDLSNALINQDCRVYLVTRNHSLEIDGGKGKDIALKQFMADHLDSQICHDVIEGRHRELGGSIRSLVYLYLKIKEFSPDVIHVQQNRDWRMFALLQLFPTTPLVYTIHDVVKHPGELRQKESFLSDAFIKRAKAIVVHGKSLRDMAIELYGRKIKGKLHVLHHGLLAGALKWDDSRIPEEPGTVLCFGRMNRYKGLDVLAKSVLLLKQRGINIKPILVGHGHEKINDLLGVDAEVLGAEVHERYVDESEIAGFFRRASVIAFPYIEASQSGVVTLAYAFKKAMVVTSVGAIPEVVVDGITGIIVQPGDVEGLANALEELVTNDGRRHHMEETAALWSEENLSWSAVADKTRALYLSILKD